MTDLRLEWRERVAAALEQIAAGSVDRAQIREAILIEEPSVERGDLAVPLFPFARLLRTNPAALAGDVAARLSEGEGAAGARIEAVGPYLNIYFDRAERTAEVVNAVLAADGTWGDSNRLQGRRVMIEFSCPNTNKPLHLGHLRNDALGSAVARAMSAAGADVHRVNLINDRGIHICKSMLAYQRFGGGATPESVGMKSDHFVGDYYVRYASWEKEDPGAEAAARAMLQRWEEGDEQTRELWERMNGWAISGIETTYRRTGITFDRTYFESSTYELGREQVLRGLERGIFTRDEKGTVWVDLTDIGLDRKVLLRGDGTSLYLTQDLGTAIQRHEDWPFTQLVYVVASEQRYHFQVLFEVLRRLGFEWAPSLHHLAYGMVNLPDGKMKSREGTVVDADALLDELATLAAGEITEKGRDGEIEDVTATAEKIALAAIHYFLLRTSPVKDMVFNPQESLSFNGDTGPYLQYLGARISSMLRKVPAPDSIEPSTPESDDEWLLVRALAAYPGVVGDAADQFNPALLAAHLYEMARTFSRFYHDSPIATAPDAEVRSRRLALSKATMLTMRHGLSILGIPFVERM